jgi:hypothetical protein
MQLAGKRDALNDCIKSWKNQFATRETRCGKFIPS